MKFNKTIAKSFVFAMALGSLSYFGAAGTEALAADKKPKAAFDGSKGTITITEHGVYWGVAKRLKSAPKKNPEKFLKMGEKEWYQIKTLDTVVGSEIDLGRYKGKNVTIAVGSKADFVGDAANWLVLNINGSNKAFKAFYSFDGTKAGKLTTVADDTLGGDYGFLSFFDGKDSQVPLAKLKTDLEVKPGAGDWQLAATYFNIVAGDSTADKVDAKVTAKLKVLTQKGSKLSFRLKGSTEAWGSKEAKISISSQKKGPSVKLDADKGLSNLKKGYLFKTILESDAIPATLDGTATGKDDFAALSIKETDNDAGTLAKKQILLVQEPKSKKMASKYTKIYITRQAVPTLKTGVDTAGIAAQGGDIIENAVEFKLNVDYDVKKGAVIRNKSTDKDYEFYLDYDGSEEAAPNKKWVKLKRAKTAEKPTTVKVAYSETKKKNAFKPNVSKIYVRLSGTKQKDNTITLASGLAKADIKVANIAQVMTIETAADTNFALGSGGKTDPAFTLKFAKETEKEYTIQAKITNVTKKSGKPKFKITSPAPKGVKVSVDALSADSSNEKDALFEIKISIDKTAFPDTPSGTMKFKVDHESLSKEYTVTFATP